MKLPIPIKIADVKSIYILPLVLAVLDQVSKFIIIEAIFTPPKIINVLPFLNLTPVWNKGISFGILGNAGDWAPVFLTLIALVIAFLLPLISREWDKLSVLGAKLMSGGALGNAIDRMIHGKVVDFIDLFAGQWHWPAFNVADTIIVFGAGLIFIGSIQQNRSESKSNS